AASIGGSVAVIDRKTRDLARTLVGPGLPVWSVAFLPDSRTLLTGGADNIIRRWDAVTGDPVDPILLETSGDPLAAYAGDRGAEIFRACVACHTLGAEQANRAGTTLRGVFGRRIATLPGYNFSKALKRLDIVWTPETVSRLFEIGPSAYTPGTKMPEQRIGSEQDRAALVKFLERATRRQPVSRPLLLRIGKEQLLAIDLVAGNRGLAFRRDQPIDKCLAEFLLHGRIFLRVHQQ